MTYRVLPDTRILLGAGNLTEEDWAQGYALILCTWTAREPKEFTDLKITEKQARQLAEDLGNYIANVFNRED